MLIKLSLNFGYPAGVNHPSMKPGRVKWDSVDWFALLFELPRLLFTSFAGPPNSATTMPILPTELGSDRELLPHRFTRAIVYFNHTELTVSPRATTTSHKWRYRTPWSSPPRSLLPAQQLLKLPGWLCATGSPAAASPNSGSIVGGPRQEWQSCRAPYCHV